MTRGKRDGITAAIAVCDRELSSLKEDLLNADPDEWIAMSVMSRGVVAMLLPQIPEPLRTVTAQSFAAGLLTLQIHMSEQLLGKNGLRDG